MDIFTIGNIIRFMGVFRIKDSLFMIEVVAPKTEFENKFQARKAGKNIIINSLYFIPIIIENTAEITPTTNNGFNNDHKNPKDVLLYLIFK